MSRSQHERGDFIREKMGLAILKDLGASKIDAIQAGDLDDLMRAMRISGVTFDLDLARNPYYLRAVNAWGTHRRAQRERSMK